MMKLLKYITGFFLLLTMLAPARAQSKAEVEILYNLQEILRGSDLKTKIDGFHAVSNVSVYPMFHLEDDSALLPYVIELYFSVRIERKEPYIIATLDFKPKGSSWTDFNNYGVSIKLSQGKQQALSPALLAKAETEINKVLVNVKSVGSELATIKKKVEDLIDQLRALKYQNIHVQLPLVDFYPVTGAQGSQYGYDRLRYPALQSEYTTFRRYDSTVVVPFKAMSTSSLDKFKAVVTRGDTSTRPANIRYRNDAGVQVMPTENPADTVAIFSLTGSSGDNEFTAYYPLVDSTGKETEVPIGRIKLRGYEPTKKNLVLVPLSTAKRPAGTISNTTLQTYLNQVYQQANIQWTVTMGNSWDPSTSVWDTDGNDTLNIESGLFSRYSGELTKLLGEFETKYKPTPETYYLFITNAPNDRRYEGYMPLNGDYGFIFTAAMAPAGYYERTIAHELGHGAFGLEHMWKKYALTQNTTANLMDYNNGTELWAGQWEYMHSWHIPLDIGMSEDDAASFGKASVVCVGSSVTSKFQGSTFLNPEGKPVIIENATSLRFFSSIDSDIKLRGTLSAFVKDNISYTTYYYKNKDTFAGYAPKGTYQTNDEWNKAKYNPPSGKDEDALILAMDPNTCEFDIIQNGKSILGDKKGNGSPCKCNDQLSKEYLNIDIANGSEYLVTLSYIEALEYLYLLKKTVGTVDGVIETKYLPVDDIDFKIDDNLSVSKINIYHPDRCSSLGLENKYQYVFSGGGCMYVEFATSEENNNFSSYLNNLDEEGFLLQFAHFLESLTNENTTNDVLVKSLTALPKNLLGKIPIEKRLIYISKVCNAKISSDEENLILNLLETIPESDITRVDDKNAIQQLSSLKAYTTTINVNSIIINGFSNDGLKRLLNVYEKFVKLYYSSEQLKVEKSRLLWYNVGYIGFLYDFNFDTDNKVEISRSLCTERMWSYPCSSSYSEGSYNPFDLITLLVSTPANGILQKGKANIPVINMWIINKIYDKQVSSDLLQNHVYLLANAAAGVTLVGDAAILTKVTTSIVFVTANTEFALNDQNTRDLIIQNGGQKFIDAYDNLKPVITLVNVTASLVDAGSLLSSWNSIKPSLVSKISKGKFSSIGDYVNDLAAVSSKVSKLEVADFNNLTKSFYSNGLEIKGITFNTTDEFVDVIVHSSNGGYVVSIDNVEYLVNEATLGQILATKVQSKTIRLVSCSSLNSAKKLSAVLANRKIIASDGTVKLFSDGTLQSSKWYSIEGETQSAVSNATPPTASTNLEKYIQLGDDVAGEAGIVSFAKQIDNTLSNLKGKAKYALDNTGEYKIVGGHHPMAKKAFEGDLAYDYQKAFSVKTMALDDAWKTVNSGIPQNLHAKITGQQNSLFTAWKQANPNIKLTIDKMAEIEIQAIKNVGIPEDIATGWVVKALEDLKLQGVTEIKNIPWNEIN